MTPASLLWVQEEASKLLGQSVSRDSVPVQATAVLAISPVPGPKNEVVVASVRELQNRAIKRKQFSDDI